MSLVVNSVNYIRSAPSFRPRELPEGFVVTYFKIKESSPESLSKFRRYVPIRSRLVCEWTIMGTLSVERSLLFA